MSSGGLFAPYWAYCWWSCSYHARQCCQFGPSSLYYLNYFSIWRQCCCFDFAMWECRAQLLWLHSFCHGEDTLRDRWRDWDSWAFNLWYRNAKETLETNFHQLSFLCATWKFYASDSPCAITVYGEISMNRRYLQRASKTARQSFWGDWIAFCSTCYYYLGWRVVQRSYRDAYSFHWSCW